MLHLYVYTVPVNYQLTFFDQDEHHQRGIISTTIVPQINTEDVNIARIFHTISYISSIQF